jgi:uracil DNA glycosylase
MECALIHHLMIEWNQNHFVPLLYGKIASQSNQQLYPNRFIIIAVPHA